VTGAVVTGAGVPELTEAAGAVDAPEALPEEPECEQAAHAKTSKKQRF
jgi:hypothetical protein